MLKHLSKCRDGNWCFKEQNAINKFNHVSNENGNFDLFVALLKSFVISEEVVICQQADKMSNEYRLLSF